MPRRLPSLILALTVVAACGSPALSASPVSTPGPTVVTTPSPVSTGEPTGPFAGQAYALDLPDGWTTFDLQDPAGAAALATALDDLRPYLAGERDDRDPEAPLTLVVASMADKAVDGVIAALVRAAALHRATVICTALDLARALPADALAGRWSAVTAVTAVGGGLRIVAEPDVDTALDRALGEARGPLVVCGSLYLVGRARARLVDDPLLRDPEEPPIR